MFSWSDLANIAQGNYLFNVGPWLTDNFYEGNICIIKSGCSDNIALDS